MQSIIQKVCNKILCPLVAFSLFSTTEAFSYYAYITSFDQGSGSNGTVTAIDTSDNSIQWSVYVGDNPTGIAVTPNGQYVYVANNQSNSVSVIRTMDQFTLNTISLGSLSPRAIAITPAGDYAYVTAVTGGGE